MNEYIDVDIELPKRTWDILEFIAKRRQIEVDELIRNILRMELDKIDAYEHLEENDPSEQVERDNGTEEDSEECK